MLESGGYQLHADITGYKNPAELFRTLRPDIVLLTADELIAIELKQNLTNLETIRKNDTVT